MKKEEFDGIKHEIVSLKRVTSHVAKEDIVFFLGELVSLIETLNDEIEELENRVFKAENRISECERDLDK